MAYANIGVPDQRLEVSSYSDAERLLIVLRGYTKDSYPTLSLHLTPAEAEVLAAQLLAEVAKVSAAVEA